MPQVDLLFSKQADLCFSMITVMVITSKLLRSANCPSNCGACFLSLFTAVQDITECPPFCFICVHCSMHLF